MTEPRIYRLTPTGRRMVLVMLVGALLIWLYGLWSFSNTLGVSYNPLRFWSTLSVSIAGGLNIGQVVPALLMLVLIVATPLLIWNLLEEWDARYTVADDGLHFQSLGVVLLYPWNGMRMVQRVDDDDEEPFDEIVLMADYTKQIRNPVLRFLHGQAYGRNKLPIYPHLERRDELLAVVNEAARGHSSVEVA